MQPPHSAIWGQGRGAWALEGQRPSGGDAGAAVDGGADGQVRGGSLCGGRRAGAGVVSKSNPTTCWILLCSEAQQKTTVACEENSCRNVVVPSPAAEAGRMLRTVQRKGQTP